MKGFQGVYDTNKVINKQKTTKANTSLNGLLLY